ncbi:c-type cytochrome biogenesis protein CcmI [Octadecabacter sp. G9-8]|uniref:C-type cytochrome biogenesis protein CcmI n=1 Tax=Octadecabacter dasysiphoniae TaxID=2909341 RepID=A0ABS9CVP9_9RHOB|nr:c-type cytochrome biogenesis protein CcmI [Octadecabacter dasysiphoniae]MCF2870449.1 c-type cytochrome biogenesis protein CcmI [Octadecabacter dasysiphoniae]
MSTEFIIFALIALALTVFAVIAVMTPLWRGRGDDASESTDIDIYRDQLSEVDRDLARGVLDPAEADRTRTEISRRLLTADADARAQSSDAPRGLSRGVAAVLAIALLAGTGALYVTLGAPGYGDVPRADRIAAGQERRENRPLQLEAEAITPIADTIDQFDQQTRDLIQTRRVTVFEQPQNIDAWTILVQTEAAIGQFQRATRAQERVVALKGDSAGLDDFGQLLDLMVASTQGYVSPEAETVALTILQDDPDNIPAIYYAGLMYAQNDRPDRAFGLWRRVIEEGDAGTIHYEFAAGQIESVAAQLGMDYVLPDRRGPSMDDIDAAQDMAPEDRQAMIEGMVGQLADRLATEGGPPQDWARLISALAVLGEDDTARTVLAEAELIFGGDVQAVTILRRAAEDAGL